MSEIARKIVLSTIVAGLLFSPKVAAAQVPTSAGNVPLLVQEKEAFLLEAGCERIPIDDTKQISATRSLGWKLVVASDAKGDTIVACAPLVAKSFTPLTIGQVAGARSAEAIIQKLLIYGLTGLTLWTFAPEISEEVQEAFEWVLEIVMNVGATLFGVAAETVPKLLALGVFVRSSPVQSAWPIVLGIVNLGFLLALVLIALFTVLRLEIGGGIRRMLPRLLIGALMVNFSLVLAGLAVDLARILMAVMPFVFPDTISLDFLSTSLQIAGSTYYIALATELAFAFAGWESAVAAFVSAIFVWLEAIALMIVVFGLAIRYVVLILLLITSPVPWLFLALPNMGGLARRWWTLFLRYLIYGPVVLAILLLASNFYPATETLGLKELFTLQSSNQKTNNFNVMYLVLFDKIIFVAFLFMAAAAGRYAGIAGSAAAIGLATGAGRRIRGVAYRGGKSAAKGGGKALYVGTGARRGVRNLRALGKEALRPVRKLYGVGEYSPFDSKKGTLKPGESTGMSRLGERIGRSRDDRKAVSGIKAAAAEQKRLGASYNPQKDQNLTADNLAKKAAVTQLSRKQIDDINLNGTGEQRAALARGLATTDRLTGDQLKAVTMTGNRSQINALANNQNIMSSSTSSQKSAIMGRVRELENQTSDRNRKKSDIKDKLEELKLQELKGQKLSTIQIKNKRALQQQLQALEAVSEYDVTSNEAEQTLDRMYRTIDRLKRQEGK